MPFTASHPAAVVCLAKWGLPPSALVIGSIAPDLPMFLPIPEVVHFAHTPTGIVTVDLAIGIAVFHLWHALLAPFLIAVAPNTLRTRLPGWRFSFGSRRRIALTLAAVGLGSVTHVVWDSFTHDWMWGTTHIPWLAMHHGPLMGYEWVRWVSDVIGMAIVMGWVLLWWRRAAQRANPPVIRLRYRVLAWLVVLVPAAVGCIYWLVRGELFFAVTRGGGLGVVCLVAVAVAWSLLPRTSRMRESALDNDGEFSRPQTGTD